MSSTLTWSTLAAALALACVHLLAAPLLGLVPLTTERLTALLTGIGVDISKRQVVRLITNRLDAFVRDKLEVLHAGRATARRITVDDTSARQQAS